MTWQLVDPVWQIVWFIFFVVVGIVAGVLLQAWAVLLPVAGNNPTPWEQLPLEKWHTVHSVHEIGRRNYFAIVINEEGSIPTFISVPDYRLLDFQRAVVKLNKFRLTYVDGKKWLFFA